MNFDRLQLRHLRCLAVVGQERNLVRAARALALTQPAVSKTIADLEDIVGRRLLVRRRRGVDLTPAGEVLVRHSVATLRGLRDGLSQALDQTEPDQLRVVVGALPNTAASLLPDALAALGRVHVALRVRVVSGTNAQLMTQLRQGEIDMVVGRLAQPSSLVDLTFVHLFSEPLLLVARPGHPLSLQTDPTLDSLTTYPMVVPVQGKLVRDTADAYLFSRGSVLPRTVIEATDTTFAIALLLRIDAVWFAPQGAVKESLRQGTLVQLAFDTRSTEGPVGVTTRRTGEHTEGARLLIATIETLCSEAATGAAPP